MLTLEWGAKVSGNESNESSSYRPKIPYTITNPVLFNVPDNKQQNSQNFRNNNEYTYRNAKKKTFSKRQ